MPDTDDGNGRVTLAILSTKLDHIREMLEDQMAEAHDRETRIRCIENERLPKLDNRIGRVEDAQGRIAAAQTVFTTVAAVIAGWFGSKS